MASKHRDIIAIEREADQEVRVTIGQNGQTTDGGGAIPGGFSQLFNRVISTLSYARLPEAAKLVYPALVWMADHRRQFVIENRGYTEIARYAGVSRSTAQKGLARLIEAGLVRLARAARPNGLGGLTANIYQLLVPIEGLEDAESPSHPHAETRYRDIPSSGTGVERQAVQTSIAKKADPVPRSGRYKQEEESKNINSAVQRRLQAAGVREPVLARLVRECDEAELLLRLKDWENRCQAGAKLGVAWLIASIRQKYDLHESTQTQIDAKIRADAAREHQEKRLREEANEDRRQREIDGQVQEMFDAMSDEELAHWKGVVVDEFPSLIRNPDRADPREHERLRRLILGKLAHLIAPSPTHPSAEPRPRAKR